MLCRETTLDKERELSILWSAFRPMDNKIDNYHHSHDLQDMDSKITKILMDSGADSMIPNIANKESAFHYCGQSGNAAVRKQLFSDLS